MPKNILWLALVMLGGACREASPPGSWPLGETDGGTPPETDAGLRIIWPAPSLTIEDAIDPLLVAAPGGVRTLLYQQGGKLWAMRGPVGGTPFELGQTGGVVEASATASPTDDRVFVAWAGRRGRWLVDGQPEGAVLVLYEGLADLSNIGTGWFAGRPAVNAYTNEVWYGSTRYPPTMIAFSLPADPGALPLPAPRADQLLDPSANPYHHHDEIHRFIDLGNGTALLFRTTWRQDPNDATGLKRFARWHHLKPKLNSALTSTHYLVSVKEGLMELPAWAAWIQPHALGDGKFALSWGSSDNSLVYDVFVAGLAIAEDGTPSLTTAAVNVSKTTGMTQNSDHALVLPTGDGRLWLAWRETDRGPRVALLDAQTFRVLRIASPPSELFCNMASSMGAVVDGEGTLHLAAGFNDGSLSVHYYELHLP